MSTARECVCKIISENANARKIVFIGVFQPIELLLKNNYHLEADIRIENTENLSSIYSGNNVDPISFLKGNSSLYYILVSTQEISEKLNGILLNWGYKPTRDFVYIQQMNNIITDLSGYHDIYGNSCDFIPKNMNIIFKGTNSKVHIDKKAICLSEVTFQIGHDSTIEIGFANIKGDLRVDNNAQMKVGDNVALRLQKLVLYSSSILEIGNRTTFTDDCEIFAYQPSHVTIGMDCMFALNCRIVCGDGHPIFEVDTGKKINSTQALEPINTITLGDHIWCGQNSTLLTKTKIGCGSIVAAYASVRGSFPNNCMIAGSLAKIKKRNIYWKRLDTSEDEQYFIKHTEDFYNE